ncbi:hypothetical protein D3C87_1893650 [compost metagenome]
MIIAEIGSCAHETGFDGREFYKMLASKRCYYFIERNAFIALPGDDQCTGRVARLIHFKWSIRGFDKHTIFQ